MGEFAGWDIPLHFKLGVAGEHVAVRTSAGVFDASHTGDLIVKGANATKAMQRIFTSNLAKCKVGEAKYVHALNDQGRIIDDPFVMRIAEDEFLCVPNAVSTQRIREWIHANGQGAVVEDQSGEVSCISVQGPKSHHIVSKIFGDSVQDLKSFHAGFFPMPQSWNVHKDARQMHDSMFHKMIQQETNAYISRTGYTGEDGFEIVLPIRAGIQLYRAALAPENECAPVGLGARETLRLEMGYLLAGQDFHDDRTPLETGHDWVVDWDHDFIGKEALLEQKKSGGYQRLGGVILEEPGQLRAGYKIFLASEQKENPGIEMGKLTSGGVSPMLNKGIGLGYFDPKSASPGTDLLIEIRDKRLKAKVAKLPMIPRTSKA